MERPCDICAGFTDRGIALEEVIVTCSKCRVSRQHIYCMRVILSLDEDWDPDNWVCESCEEGNGMLFPNSRIKEDTLESLTDRSRYGAMHLAGPSTSNCSRWQAHSKRQKPVVSRKVKFITNEEVRPWWRSLSDNHWGFPDDAVFAAIFHPLYDTLGESDRFILDAQRDREERGSGAATGTRLAPPPAPATRRPTGIVIRERDPAPESAPRRRTIRRPEGVGDKEKAPAQKEPAADHDGETAPVVPQPTSGESSRKRPIEDEEELLEDERYQREHALVRRRIRPRLAVIEGATAIVEVPTPEPNVGGQTMATEEVAVQPSSPTDAPGETGPIPEPISAPAKDEDLGQSTRLSDFAAPLAVPPEDFQPEPELSPLQPDPTAQTNEVAIRPIVPTRFEVPPPVPEIEAVAEVEPTTPAPTRISGEAASSLGTRTARLRARTTPPADPEPIRLVWAFFHRLLRQGRRMNVFDLVGRAREAHEALSRQLAGGNPALDHVLELTDAVELQARRVQDVGAQSAAHKKVRQALDNQMAALLAELGDAEIPEASSENPSTVYARQVEALEAQIAELQAQLAQAHQNLARAEEVKTRVQAAEETQEALDSAIAAADEAQAQADDEELALKGLLMDLYKASRRV